MSTFAFGTYRITDLNALHIEALKEAMYSGITLFDTSTNYMDGGAERAIAKAMAMVDYSVRDKIEIVSKFGYIQGTNLAKYKKKEVEDVVEFSETCYHSIAKSFLKEQLSESLQRLELETIDCYLIHNPEYFIYDALKKEISRADMLDTMYARIYEAFIGLEEEVLDGRIKSYGISSNSFAKPSSHPEFLPYEDLLTLAQKAALEVGLKSHHFTTIQLPINILETEGLKCAAWAKRNGLCVLSNRPLNAQKDDLMFRLAEYEEPKEYFHALNELLELCDTKELKKLYNLVEQMDANKHKFGWIGDYDNFLYSQILPHIKEAIGSLNTEMLDILLNYIDNFLNEYRKMVAYECSRMTRSILKKDFTSCKGTMQECALEFLIKQNAIDYVLVGVRKPSYVQEVLALIDRVK